jgi:hypothetical protein
MLPAARSGRKEGCSLPAGLAPDPHHHLQGLTRHWTTSFLLLHPSPQGKAFPARRNGKGSGGGRRLPAQHLLGHVDERHLAAESAHGLRHLHPELVDADAFDAASEDGADCWGEWQSGTNLAYDTVEFSKSGAVGDPGQSSAAAGEQLLAAAADSLAALMETVAERDIGEKNS